MFNAIIVTPGGPGAEAEAKRFNGYSKFYTLTNSMSGAGCPKWFGELVSEDTVELSGLKVDRLTEAIMGNVSPTQVAVGYTVGALSKISKLW